MLLLVVCYYYKLLFYILSFILCITDSCTYCTLLL
nr:MAG TPA: hypothetical protein [Caudoviricetes sp.]